MDDDGRVHLPPDLPPGYAAAELRRHVRELGNRPRGRI
jgi:hypothetical protein